jgi:hypothetical protein
MPAGVDHAGVRLTCMIKTHSIYGITKKASFLAVRYSILKQHMQERVLTNKMYLNFNSKEPILNTTSPTFIIINIKSYEFSKLYTQLFLTNRPTRLFTYKSYFFNTVIQKKIWLYTAKCASREIHVKKFTWISREKSIKCEFTWKFFTWISHELHVKLLT